MKILLAFLIFMLIVCAFMLYICSKGGNSKLYCYLYTRDEWNGWETIIKNFDAVVFDGYHANEDHPEAECYSFDIPTLGDCHLNYWVKTNSVSAHDYPKLNGCLSTFGQYHQGVVKELLCKKFDFMREIIDPESYEERS